MKWELSSSTKSTVTMTVKYRGGTENANMSKTLQINQAGAGCIIPREDKAYMAQYSKFILNHIFCKAVFDWYKKTSIQPENQKHSEAKTWITQAFCLILNRVMGHSK